METDEAQDPVTGTQSLGRPNSSTALLVIHGIGRQQPLQALDSFVNGLREASNVQTIWHSALASDEVLDQCIKLRGLVSRLGPIGCMDVYEFYWAPLTTKKASFRDVVSWLVKTSLTPLTRLSFNLALIYNRAREKEKKRKAGQPSLDEKVQQSHGQNQGFLWELTYGFGRELRRVVVILVVTLILAFLALALVTSAANLLTTIWDIGKESALWDLVTKRTEGESLFHILDLRHLLALVLLLGTVAMITLLLVVGVQGRDLFRLWRGWKKVAARSEKLKTKIARTWKTRIKGFLPDLEWDEWRMETQARALFLILSVVALPILLVVLFVLAVVLSWSMNLTTGCQLVWDIVFKTGCFPPVIDDMRAALTSQLALDLLTTGILVLVAFWIKRIFVDYLGDIAVYTTTDERSVFFEVRRQILQEAVRKLRWLLRRYESVAIAGHSLGSVIGYDAINMLRHEARVSMISIDRARHLLEELEGLVGRRLDVCEQAEPLRLISEMKRSLAIADPFDPALNFLEPLDRLARLKLMLPEEDGQILAEQITQIKSSLAQKSSPEMRSITDKEFRRLCTFITFGSPLNKVLYFFRRKLGVNETVRAHIVEELYGYKRLRIQRQDPDIRHDSEDIWAQNSSELPYWLNVYSPMDPISAQLTFYENTCEYARWYLIPGLCHMRYWQDPKFYRAVLEAIAMGKREQLSL